MNLTSTINRSDGKQRSARGWTGPTLGVASSSSRSRKIGASSSQSMFWTWYSLSTCHCRAAGEVFVRGWSSQVHFFMATGTRRSRANRSATVTTRRSLTGRSRRTQSSAASRSARGGHRALPTPWRSRQAHPARLFRRRQRYRLSQSPWPAAPPVPRRRPGRHLTSATS